MSCRCCGEAAQREPATGARLSLAFLLVTATAPRLIPSSSRRAVRQGAQFRACAATHTSPTAQLIPVKPLSSPTALCPVTSVIIHSTMPQHLCRHPQCYAFCPHPQRYAFSPHAPSIRSTMPSVHIHSTMPHHLCRHPQHYDFCCHPQHYAF